MRVTIVDLAKLTGLDRHTVAARLARANVDHEPDSPGNSKQYESTRALPALFHAPLSSVESLRQRRGELLAAQTERAKLELEKERDGFIPKPLHYLELAEMALRYREFALHLPDVIELVQPLDSAGYYRVRRAVDEYLERCQIYLAQNGIAGETFVQLLAKAQPACDAIKTIGDDPVIHNPDFLERFSSAPSDRFEFRFSVNPSRYINFGSARLEHLLELRRQLEVLRLPVPKVVDERIAQAERGWLPPLAHEVIFGKKNRDGTPCDAPPAAA